MSSEKCVKGKVVTDVGQDLGGGPTGSLEHSWPWVAKKGLPFIIGICGSSAGG